MQIIPYTPQYFTSVLGVLNSVSLVYVDDSPRRFEASVRHDPQSIMIAVDGNTCIGFLWGYYGADNGLASILRVAVNNEKQGKGVGTMLLSEAERIAFSCGNNLLDVHIRPKSEQRLVTYYQNRGFLKAGEPLRLVKTINPPYKNQTTLRDRVAG